MVQGQYSHHAPTSENSKNSAGGRASFFDPDCNATVVSSPFCEFCVTHDLILSKLRLLLTGPIFTATMLCSYSKMKLMLFGDKPTIPILKHDRSLR